MATHFAIRLQKSLFTIYYNHTPQNLKKLFSPAIFLIKFRLLARIQHLYLPIYVLHGKTKQSGLDFNILFIGDDLSCSYLSSVLYAKEPKKEALGKVFIFNIGKTLGHFSSQTDAIFVKTDRFFSRFLQKKGCIILPEWVDMRLDVSSSLETVYKKFKKSAKENIRTAEKYGYSYEISTDYDKLSLFYHKLCVPFISKRHGTLALTEATDYQDIKSIFDRGKLLLVKEKNRYVSGFVIGTYGETAFPVYMGVANDRHLSRRAGSALYYFFIRWAKENGFTSLRFGDARPFLNDGLFQYKRKWGMAVNISKTRFGIFGFKPCNFRSKAIKDFLENNPFAYIDGEQLNGLIFVHDRVTSDTIQQIHKRYYMSGLTHLSIVSSQKALERVIKNLDSKDNKEESILPDNIAEHIRLLPDVITTYKKTDGGQSKAKKIHLSNTIDKAEIEKIIDKIVSERKEFVKHRGLTALDPLMGIIMEELRGKADGKFISSILRRKIEEVDHIP